MKLRVTLITLFFCLSMNAMERGDRHAWVKEYLRNLDYEDSGCAEDVHGIELGKRSSEDMRRSDINRSTDSMSEEDDQSPSSLKKQKNKGSYHG